MEQLVEGGETGGKPKYLEKVATLSTRNAT
jgi:hypothetical protein